MKKEVVIILNFNRKYFEEIYELEKYGNYISSPNSKNSFRVFIVSCFLLFFFAIKMVLNKGGGISLFFPFCIFLGSLIVYLTKANAIRKWKLNVSNYLDSVEKYKSHEIVLAQNCFSVIQDENVTMEKWTNVTKINIQKNHIGIFGKEDYLVPNKCLSKEDYVTFKEIITHKMNEI